MASEYLSSCECLNCAALTQADGLKATTLPGLEASSYVP
jgi:hypothetical protein